MRGHCVPLPAATFLVSVRITLASALSDIIKFCAILSSFLAPSNFRTQTIPHTPAPVLQKAGARRRRGELENGDEKEDHEEEEEGEEDANKTRLKKK